MFKFSYLMYQPKRLVPVRELSALEIDAFSLHAFGLYLKEILLLSDEAHQALNRDLLRHVGADSVFSQKAELIRILTHLFYIMSDERSASKKAGMASVLIEDIDKCTNGFYDRANDLYLSVNTQESLGSWLYDVRYDLVNRCARFAANEVHTHNRYLIRAARKYGLLAPAPDDAYRGGLSDRVIDYDVKGAFDFNYLPLTVLSLLSTRLKRLILERGMARLIDDKKYHQSVMDDVLHALGHIITHQAINAEEFIDFDEDYTPLRVNTAKIKRILYLELVAQGFIIELTDMRERFLNVLCGVYSDDDLCAVTEGFAAKSYYLIHDLFNYLPDLPSAQKMALVWLAAFRILPANLSGFIILISHHIDAFDELIRLSPRVVHEMNQRGLHTVYRFKEAYHCFLRNILNNKSYTGLYERDRSGYTGFNILIQYPQTFEFCLNELCRIPSAHLDCLADMLTPEGFNLVEFALSSNYFSPHGLQTFCEHLSRDGLKEILESIFKGVRVSAVKFITSLSPAKFNVLIHLSVLAGLHSYLLGQALIVEQHMAHIAAFAGFLDGLRRLSECGASLEAPALGQMTPMHTAAQYGQLDIIQLLIEKNVAIDPRNDQNATPLHLAVFKKQLFIVKYLVEHGAEMNAQTNQGLSPVHLAVQIDAMDIMIYLFEKGVDIHFKNTGLQTPLHAATIPGRLSFVRYLVEHGSKVNEQDYMQ